MQLSSPGFDADGLISWRHSAPGANELPPLDIRDVPDDTRSLALVFENVDSPLGPVTHWLAWNIPPETSRIDAVSLPPESRLGMDAFGKIGYFGPAPPEGRPRFRFVLYALDCVLELETGATRQLLDAAMDGHVLATAELSGYAQRPDEDQ